MTNRTSETTESPTFAFTLRRVVYTEAEVAELLRKVTRRFTREDVDMLRRIATLHRIGRASSLADRIEALLPREDGRIFLSRGTP